jgi:hypothetical protein
VNKPEGGSITEAPAADAVVVPTADEDWHPVARMWFESLASSGQSRFYEPSDWSMAFLIAESISRDLKPQFIGFVQTGRDSQEAEYGTIPIKGASLGAYLKAMGSLLVSEGDRRRARLELQRVQTVDVDEAASVTAMSGYRARFGA